MRRLDDRPSLDAEGSEHEVRVGGEVSMLIPDYETEVDYLNCEAISQTVVEILKVNRSGPVTIGIHGDWGAGKSSVLKMIESELAEDGDVAVLWFNGWTFEGFDDAKTILIESTITELCRQRSTIGKVREVAGRLLRRVDWLKVAKRCGGGAFNVLTGLPSPDQIGSAVAALQNVVQNVADIDPADVRTQLEAIGGFLKPAEDGDNLPETIHAFRQEFQELLDQAKIGQLVVLIDDLDRCLPATAIQTLEAIRLFLFVPKTAFVIGADEAMIEYAVRQHFPDLPAASGPLPYARNYLEKLIQVPFRIPSLGAQETRVYVLLLLLQSLVGEDHPGFGILLEKAKEGLRKPWLGTDLPQSDVQATDPARVEELNAAFVLAHQIAPILAEGTKGNPRQVKRFLNALLLRQLIARARGFDELVSRPVLAKLMLAERFQPDFYEHVAAQAMSSGDGKAGDIVALERFAEEPRDGTEHEMPGKDTATDKVSVEPGIEKWLERDWLKRWLTIQPQVGDTDLRPYIFVARDKRLLTSAGGPSGLDALIAKLCGSQLEVRTAEAEVKALTPGDAENVFAALRERVLGAGSFTQEPQGIGGLSIVAKHHPRLQGEVVKLLGSLDPRGLGLWVVKGWSGSVTEEKAKRELQDVVQGWANQEDNKLLKQAASAALPALGKGTG
ncbi:MAG: AAA family ATPase [Armatimonadetes bacterium]|nr:AAA family ATPase [Armatimonadota bacterium]